jgi:acyl-coenzyme A synthetase/AMP-(fatty) acid ligase
VRIVDVRDEGVPRTATGKIQHRLLRDRIVASSTCREKRL